MRIELVDDAVAVIVRGAPTVRSIEVDGDRIVYQYLAKLDGHML